MYGGMRVLGGLVGRLWRLGPLWVGAVLGSLEGSGFPWHLDGFGGCWGWMCLLERLFLGLRLGGVRRRCCIGGKSLFGLLLDFWL